MEIGDRIKNMLEEKGENSSNDISRILSLFEKERERERELGSWMSEIFAEHGNSWPRLKLFVIHNFCQKIIENRKF